MDFEIIDGITRADVAFRIYGKDLRDLFFAGAKALLSVMIQDMDSIEYKIKEATKLENENIELLLYDFLQEIIFYKDSESLILFPKSIDFIKSGNTHKFKCEFHGEEIDNKKHKIMVDVKAVTFHKLKVEKIENGWEGTFVLDV